MSVKQMTSDQIQDDLEQITRQWAGGIPPEQADRINALKSELKRRGEQARVVRPQANGNSDRPKSIKSMTDEQLEKEMRKLSENMSADDDEAQERFANLRFEVRQRAKQYNENSSPPVTPRAIEIPDQADIAKAADYSDGRGNVSDGRGKAAATVVRNNPARKIPVGVKGFSAQVGGTGIVVRYTAQDQYGNIAQIAGVLTWDEADQLAAQILASVDEAKSLTKASS